MLHDQCQILRRLLLELVGCMGCLFGCFRVKDSDRYRPPLVSDPVVSKAKDPFVSRNRLGALLLREEQSLSEEHTETQQSHSRTSDRDGDVEEQELKDEAKFLKSCGALLQTPAEIRKRSEKELQDGDGMSTKFHSWLSGTACKKLDWDGQTNQKPDSAIKVQEEKGQLSLHETLSYQQDNRSMPSIQQTGRTYGESLNKGAVESKQDELLPPDTDGISLSDVPVHPGSTTQYKIRSVRFDQYKHVRGESIPLKNPSIGKETLDDKQFDSPDSEDGKDELVGHRYSPYPTPLRLTDDMQTPGTVYPAKLQSFATGKNIRVRSQYLYPVLKPVENISQWSALKEVSDAYQQFESGGDPNLGKSESPEHFPGTKRPIGILDEPSPLPVEVSLSHWIKPLPPLNERNQSVVSTSNGRSHSSRSTDVDRPIIGAVAAHWNDEEPTIISAKEWDGNGIPNSTTKYKEDQKVSWHATPFEERLEKALSDERLFPRKRLHAQLIHFEESEESDTATSSLTRPETTILA